jgi:twitching motility protein PilT
MKTPECETQACSMNALLRELCRLKGSDLLLTVGTPPQVRINGELAPLPGDPLSVETVRRLAHSLLNEAQIVELTTTKQCDFSFGVEGLARFRMHVYHQRNSLALAVRLISFDVGSIEQLGIPQIVREFTAQPNGLVLVTGPAGSGKSTTLAAMIDLINQTRHVHIVTIEDPIEYVHHHKRSVVDQREVGVDAISFGSALHGVFRESPDVVMVGEMRDLETIQLALSLAETGHLILATLHTQDTTHAISRIVDVFPADHQQQIAIQLSLVLVGVLSQQLVPTADNSGRVLACEVMNVNSAIRNLIRERQMQQVYSVIQTSRAENMVTLNDALFALCERRRILPSAAMQRSARPKELAKLLGSRLDAGWGAGQASSRLN